MSKQNTGKPSNPCEKYEFAITHYVLGEKIDIPQKELFNHLAQCPSCQGDLRNWRATYATMRAKEYDARPEVKQKMKTFITELVASQPAPGETRPAKGGVKPIRGAMLDHEAETGTLAGKVWHTLGKYGEVRQTDLPKKAKLHPLKAHEGLGWLMYQKKVYKTKDKRTIYLYLNETEREIYLSR